MPECIRATHSVHPACILTRCGSRAPIRRFGLLGKRIAALVRSTVFGIAMEYPPRLGIAGREEEEGENLERWGKDVSRDGGERMSCAVLYCRIEDAG